jgi:integrase
MGTPRRQTTVTLKALYKFPAVKLLRQNAGRRVYARVTLGGRRYRYNTGETSMAAAEKAAEDWYIKLLAGRHVLEGTAVTLPTKRPRPMFKDAYESFIARAETDGKRSPGQVKNLRDKWTLLKADLEPMALEDITLTWLEDLRLKRSKSTHIIDALGRTRKRLTPLNNGTLSKDMDFIRLVLKHAWQRMGVLAVVPPFPEFDGQVWSVLKTKRPFLPPHDWTRLKKAALARANEQGLNPRTRRQRQSLYAYIMMSVGAALRPSEAYSLRWKDCQLGMWGKDVPRVRLQVGGKWTKGQRVPGWAVNDGVIGFKYLQRVYPDAKPGEYLFPEEHREGMKELLIAAGLREDELTEKSRNAKSLRSTGISLRVMEPNVDYNDLAVWARTTPQHIADFYDQVDPDWKVRRMVTLEMETDRDRDIRTRRESVARQMKKDAMKDNDDIMGEDREAGDEPDDDPDARSPKPTKR